MSAPYSGETLTATLDYLEVAERQESDSRLADPQAGELADAGAVVITQDDYELTVAAIRCLGITSTKRMRIPEYREIVEKLDEATTTYLAEHLGRGDVPDLRFVLPLSDRYGFDDLTDRFLEKYRGEMCIAQIWDGYSHQQHNNGIDRLTPVVALNDSKDPGDSRRDVNEFEEPGLVYVDAVDQKQAFSLCYETRDAARRGVAMRSQGLTDYLVGQTKRLIAGLPLMDKRTCTNFVDYPTRRPNHRSRYAEKPIIAVCEEGFNFGYVRDCNFTHGMGIRRSVLLNGSALTNMDRWE